MAIFFCTGSEKFISTMQQGNAVRARHHDFSNIVSLVTFPNRSSVVSPSLQRYCRYTSWRGKSPAPASDHAMDKNMPAWA